MYVSYLMWVNVGDSMPNPNSEFAFATSARGVCCSTLHRLPMAMSQSLKRPSSSQDNGPQEYPELPPLRGDLILDIFTHKSIEVPGSSHPGYGDNARLAELGHQALEFAITETLFRLKDPMLNVEELSVSHGSSCSCM